jgi:two-component system LytT family response regulator
LQRFYPDIEIKALCPDAKRGIAAITRFSPDLLLLDIEMPDMNGFEMLRSLPVLQSEVIFITAHDEYAINAIRFSALDYLLKPVRPDMLKGAMNRALPRIREKKFPAQYRSLLSNTQNQQDIQLHNLAIPTVEGLVFVKLAHVIRCESDGKYTLIYLIGKKMHMASRTLGEFEELLKTSGFIRIHKSHLINSRHLKRYIRGEGGQVILTDHSHLPVARRKKNELLKLVSQL